MKMLQAIGFLCAAWFGVSMSRAANLHATIKDATGRPLVDAIVLATPVDPKNRLHTPPADAVDQVDKQFVPYVKVIYAGSKVRFPNKDNIRHQVYSFSPAKKFELPLYAGSEAPPVTFEKPGVVVLGCNIHDWMVGYIYVADTPFFAKTETAGSAEIDALPTGEYVLRIWHPNMAQTEESTVKRIAVTGDESVRVEWQLAVKPGLRIPRIQGDSGAGYP